MSSIVRYEDLLQQFHNDVNRVLAPWRQTEEGGEDRTRIATSAWAPAVDIKEETDRFVLYADIPGVDPKDIEITMERGVLTIKGERRHEDVTERSGYKRVERSYGTFYRRFSLPDTADADAITAKGKNGVLEIVLPKKEQAQPRRIAVK
jgi:HSP20 family protein